MASGVDAEETAEIITRRFARASGLSPAAERLRKQVAKLATTVASELGATRVFLFGSLVWGGAHSATDIDLAVEGLPSVQIDSFSAGLIQGLGLIPDVLRLEDAPPSLRRRVEESGEVIWERKGGKS